jgi:predicted dehydrogenase
MTIKTGLFGAGAFGANHAAKLAALPSSAFQGVFDADPARAAALAERHGVRAYARAEELLAAVDAVIVATPALTHGALAGAALAAGKHALVEKPLAASLREADALVAAAQAKRLVLQAGHQERFVIAALGLDAAPERPTRLELIRETPFTGRGMDVSVTFDLMIHDLDLAALLFAAAPVKIEARGRAEHGAPLDEVEARLLYAGGEALLRASRIAPARKRTLKAAYPSGVVEIDFLERKLVKNTTPFALDPDFADKAADPLGCGVETFLEAIAANKPSAIPGKSGAAAVALAEAIDAACAR